MLTGAVQVVVGALRAGRVFRYVPYPVHAGVMNGVAVLMAVAMLPHVLGLADSGGRDARAGAVAVALAAAVMAWRPMRWTRALPAYLTALLAATALHHALRLAFGESSLGPLLGPMPFDWPAWATLAPLARGADAALLLDKLPLLLEFAVAGALMASLQSMMAMALVDAVTRTRRDGERELLVQGLANIGAGGLGTLQNCGAISRSRVNIDAGGSSGASRAAFGLCLVLLLAAGSALLRHVPMAAIAGVFLAVAFSLVDGWSRRATGVIARRLSRAAAPPRSLTQSYAVMLLVAGTTVFVSLSHGLALGVLAAMVMFIRSNSRQPIRAIEHADRRTSRKVRPAHVAALLREHGRRIAVLELDGPLFFGTADVAAREIEHLGSEATQIVVDFTRVSEVDASGARVLVQAAEELHMARRRLLLAALPAHDLRRRTIREMDVHESLAEADFFDDADLALESAEDRLLDVLAPPPEEPCELPLPSTMLGAGLSPADIEALSALLVRLEVPRGTHVFRSGDESHAMFVSVLGQVGIWLPAGQTPGATRKRLVSFTPGVVFGEMGLLERRPRSADAVAEDDAVLLVLSRQAFERLSVERPALIGQLMLNLSLHLSARVRALTEPPAA